MDLTITPWRDPLVEAPGYPADSIYVKLFWLPVLGPTATLLLEGLNFDFTTEPDGFTAAANEIACTQGIGLGFGRNAPLRRAIERCIEFGLMKQVGPAHYAVRTFAPPLSEDDLSLLTPALQQLHASYRSETAFDSK
jgi:hypothetical protein